MKRASGSLDVYTGILLVAFLVLAGGIFLLATKNIDHSTLGNTQGGPIKLID